MKKGTESLNHVLPNGDSPSIFRRNARDRRVLLSIDPVVEKIHKTGFFNWLYAGVAWFFASGIILFCLLFLCVGKNQDNMYGPNPYAAAK